MNIWLNAVSISEQTNARRTLYDIVQAVRCSDASRSSRASMWSCSGLAIRRVTHSASYPRNCGHNRVFELRPDSSCSPVRETTKNKKKE